MTNLFKQKSNIYTLVCLIITAVLLVCSAYAWFDNSESKYGDTEGIIIQEPPILYILDSDAEDITQLDLTGMEIGVTKRLVFCISSIYPVESDSTGFKGSFSLQLIYTNNLAANYSIYSADIVSQPGADTVEYVSQAGTVANFRPGTMLDGVDVTQTGNEIAYTDDSKHVQEKNLATYIKYPSTDIDTEPNFCLRFEDNIQTGINNTINCRFFILEITWDNTSNVDSKETDMVYIIAKGGL